MSIWLGDVIIEYDFSHLAKKDRAQAIVAKLSEAKLFQVENIQIRSTNILECDQKYRSFMDMIIEHLQYEFHNMIALSYKRTIEIDHCFYNVIEPISDYIFNSFMNCYVEDDFGVSASKLADIVTYDAFETALLKRARELEDEHKIKISNKEKINFFVQYCNLKASAASGMALRLISGNSLKIADKQDLKHYSNRHYYRWNIFVEMMDGYCFEYKELNTTSDVWQQCLRECRKPFAFYRILSLFEDT